ncbi:MAG TPA: OFA family MFS transporter [Vicinamibacterales bacterium]|nr:OFA family MFS transporter [Vicinamibacterales bacterium]
MPNRWLPVFGGILMNLALGSLYAWSVFVPPLEKEFGWTRGQTSWVYTIAIVCFALTFVAAGRIQDVKGPRLCAFLGGALVSAGFVLASFTTSLTMLYLFYGVIVGVGNGFGYATPMPVGSKWFPDRRGLVVGLMVGGYGAGSAIFGTLASGWLVPGVGWRTTFQILGAIFFVMTMIGTALLKNPPAGYRPPATADPGARTAGSEVARRPPRDLTTPEMLRTRTFYALWIAYCLGTTAGQMTISQLVPFARAAGLGATVATVSLVVTACGNASGRIFSGWMSDALGRLRTLATMILLSAVAMPALFFGRTQAVTFYAFVALVYWCYGTQLSVFASTTADFYGTKHLGLNYGVLFTAWGAAGILGPSIAGRVFDRFGDYRYAFFAASALAVVAFVSLSFARAPSAEPAHL